MSSFEYVMVIVSIIMGLGVATLLRGTVNMLRAESRWRPRSLHSLWVANVLLVHIGLWSLRWSGGGREEWPFWVLVAYLLMPIVLYALAELLFPRSEEAVDLADYFLANRRLFLGLFATVLVAGLIGPLIFYDGVNPLGRLPGSTGMLVPLAFIGAFAAFAFVSSPRLHLVLAVTVLVGFSWGMSVLAVGG